MIALRATVALAALLAAVPGLHVEDVGQGPVVVLVHAFHMDLRQWDEQLRALRAYRVVRYDVRGHGKSEPSVGDHAAYEDLAAVLRDLGIERAAAVVGHSMGGQIAVDFALAHPAMLDRLVVVSPAVSGFNAAPGPWLKPIIDAVRAGQPQRAGELWWDSPFMAGVNARGKAGEPYRQIVMDNARIWTLPRRADTPLQPPAINRLSELKARTLVIIGERDEEPLRGLAQRIAAEAPSARLVDMKGVGHMAPMERPAEFNRLLVEFLR